MRWPLTLRAGGLPARRLANTTSLVGDPIGGFRVEIEAEAVATDG